MEYFQGEYPHAQRNFIESLAGYSIVCYLLQIKDRHNGNILIDNQGHIIHIDFGFILSISPGNMNFERAAFKITKDYLDMMNGRQSHQFKYFSELIYQGFMILQENYRSIFQLIEIMMENSFFNCFKYFEFDEFKNRFKIGLEKEEV